MESSEQQQIAREQLDQLNEATSAAEGASVLPWPWWFGAALGAGGTGIVWLFTAALDDRSIGQLEENLLRIGGALLLVAGVVGLVVALRYERRNTIVKPLAPIMGGRTTKWSLLMNLSVALGLIVATNLVTINDINSPYVMGIATFGWLAIVPRYLWGRHVRQMNEL